MAGKTIPISARLTPDDAEFIARLEVEGATTPSEKLRAIIVDARQRYDGTEDFIGSLKLVEEMLAPTLRIIRASEYERHMHSELVTRMADWVPECMAYLLASNGTSKELSAEQLMEIEEELLARVLVLMQSVLQMAVTRSSSCYEPTRIDRAIGPMLELVQVIIDNRRKTESGKQ